MDCCIKVENLTKNYGQLTAIKDLSFSIEKGDVVGFLGPNGAGKSTTMRILSGLMPATSGEAFVSGLSVAEQAAEVKSRIGYMAENNPLPDDMRVMEYLRWRAQLKGLKGKHLKSRLDEVIELCDLHRKASRRLIGNLSKGFKQRVGIADAILAEPEVAILDEPTIGLDPHQLLLIRKLIDQLRGKMTIIISSHILSEVEISCDKVIILNQGRVVASGTSEELCETFIEDQVYELQFLGEFSAIERCVKNNFPAGELVQTMETIDGRKTCHVYFKENVDLAEAMLQKLSVEPAVRLQGLYKKEATLEDIFLAATKRSWDIVENKIAEGESDS